MATKATLFVERDTSSAGLADRLTPAWQDPGIQPAVLQIDFVGLLQARDDSLNQSLLAKEIGRKVTSVDPHWWVLP